MSTNYSRSSLFLSHKSRSVNAEAGTGKIKAKLTDSDLGNSPIPPERTRDMHIGENEIEIVEHEPTLGLKTNILYYTTTDENFPALIRKVTFTNTGDGSLSLEALGMCTLRVSCSGRTGKNSFEVYVIHVPVPNELCKSNPNPHPYPYPYPIVDLSCSISTQTV